MKRLLAILFAISASSVMADAPLKSSGMPPPGYAKPVFVDSQGCTYVRATVGDWVLWVQQLDSMNRPACHGHSLRTKPQHAIVVAKQL